MVTKITHSERDSFLVRLSDQPGQAKCLELIRKTELNLGQTRQGDCNQQQQMVCHLSKRNTNPEIAELGFNVNPSTEKVSH